MGTVIKKTNIKRSPGWLYFIDSQGDVSRTRQRGAGKKEKVKKTGIKKTKGFIYYLDSVGNIARAKKKN